MRCNAKYGNVVHHSSGVAYRMVMYGNTNRGEEVGLLTRVEPT